MKRFILFTTILLIFFLCSCRTIVQTPQITEKQPDVIKKSVVSQTTTPAVVDVPKETTLVTKETGNTVVFTQNDTKVEIPSGLDTLLKSADEKEVILPKNTEIVLPPNTPIKTVNPIKLTMESGTEVVLPAGTEITTTKINWYAIMFYVVVILGLGWYYLHIRKQPEDTNNDGLVDDDKVVVGKRNIKKTKK